MIFSQKYVTRWHDTDASRRVRATQLLVYMQETSNHHLQSCGISLDELRDRHSLAFILSKIRLAIYRPLYAFEEIEVQTWTGEEHGLSIPRFYRILRDGETVAEADTVWALVNLDTQALVKGSECKILNFEHECFPTLDIPTRFSIPKGVELSSVGKRRIVWSDLDYNMHMNNTRYPDMLCDFIAPEDIGKIKGFLLSYVNEAAFTDELDVRCARADDSYFFRTVNSAGKTCLDARIILSENTL